MDKNMTWDLTQMYPDLDAWQADLKKAQDIAESNRRHAGHHYSKCAKSLSSAYSKR